MNRQVPNKKYTIVGDGKVARHFAHYFSLVNIEYNQWNRKQPLNTLQQSVAGVDTVLLLISDNAIEQFIKKHSCLIDKTLVHFSGVLISDIAFGCHPLMTFANELYQLETYLSVPFICDDKEKFESLFPQLINKSFNINKKNKAYYHLLCVIAGNFTQILMQESRTKLSTELNLPTDILFPYLSQNTKNFIANPENSATGPIQRNDFSTIKKHLKVVEGDSLETIYKSFLTHVNGRNFNEVTQ